MRRVTAGLLLLTALGLSACDGVLGRLNGCRSDYTRPDYAAMQADLNAARARWAAADIQNYTFTQIHSSFAGEYPVTLTVRAGQVTQVSPPEAQSRLAIPALLDGLQSMISGPNTTKCLSFSASYDPGDGHPTAYSFAILDPNIADGFGGWRIPALKRD